MYIHAKKDTFIQNLCIPNYHESGKRIQYLEQLKV